MSAEMHSIAFDPARTMANLGVSPPDICADSRQMIRGAVFAAFPGARHDGRRFIPQAIRAGAVGVLWDGKEFEWRNEWRAPNYPVRDLRERLGDLADFVYHSPSAEMSVLGITGTNGKTTICHFAAQLLSAAGMRAAVLGTAGDGFPPDLRPSDLTTADAATMHKKLRDLRSAGADAVALEASSHGLSQGRLNGMRIRVGVFANLGRDHLDYHGDEQDYFRAKAKLFDSPGMELAVVNADDPRGVELSRRLADKMRIVSFGESRGDWRLRKFSTAAGGRAEFEVEFADGGQAASALPFPGRHNAMNFIAAALAAEGLGANRDAMMKSAPSLTLPPGRMQRVNVGGRPAAFVDYAHAPESLAAAIAAARELNPQALRLVFGCGGGRDTGKRAQMGAVARAADRVFVTDDNPRDEDPESVAAPVLKAAGQCAVRVADRRDAISRAVSDASDGDVILVAGKGHEQMQIFENGRAVPFCDAEVLRQALSMREGSRQ